MLSPSLQPSPNDPASKVIGGILADPMPSNAPNVPAKGPPSNDLASHVISVLHGSATPDLSLPESSSLANVPHIQSHQLATQAAVPMTAIAGQPIAKGSSGIVIIGGNTISLGQVTTIEGTPISVGRNGLVALDTARTGSISDPNFVNGDPQADNNPQRGSVVNAANDPAHDNTIGKSVVFTLGSQVVTGVERTMPSGAPIVVAGSLTIIEGGSASTVAGTVVSAGANGVRVGNQIVEFSDSPGAHSNGDLAQGSTRGAMITLGSSTFTAVEESESPGSSSIVLIGSQTLTVDGAPITANGETIIASPSGLVIIGNDHTTTVPFSTVSESPVSTPVTEAIVTIGSSIVTAIEESGVSGSPAVVLMDGQTLTVGGAAITINGETISAGSSGIVVVSGRSTITDSYSTAVQTTSISRKLTQDPSYSNAGGAISSSATTAGGRSAKDDQFARFGLVGHCLGIVLTCVMGVIL